MRPGRPVFPKEALRQSTSARIRSRPKSSFRTARREGVIIATGGGAGYTLFVKDGKVVYDYNFFGKAHYRVVSDIPLPTGEVEIVLDYSRSRSSNSSKAQADRRSFTSIASWLAKARSPKSVGTFSATRTMDFGMDLGATVRKFITKIPILLHRRSDVTVESNNLLACWRYVDFRLRACACVLPAFRDVKINRMAAFSLTLAMGLLLATGSHAAESVVRRDILPPPAPEFKGKIGTTYKDSVPDFGPAMPACRARRRSERRPHRARRRGLRPAFFLWRPDPHAQYRPTGGARAAIQQFPHHGFCSPSRGALLTGRNHHEIGLAAITEAATGYPGSNGSIPKSAGTIAEVLKQNGYNTMAIGKWHLDALYRLHFGGTLRPLAARHGF